jgi:hypothetical protein
MNRRLLLALAVAAGLLAGCSDSAIGSRSSVDPAVPTQLRQDVRAVADDLAAHRFAQARDALTALDADTAAAHTAGKLSDADLVRIRAAAATLAGDLDHRLQAPAPTVTVTKPASPKHAPPKHAPPPKPAGHGKDHKGGGDGEGDG